MIKLPTKNEKIERVARSDVLSRNVRRGMVQDQGKVYGTFSEDRESKEEQ